MALTFVLVAAVAGCSGSSSDESAHTVTLVTYAGYALPTAAAKAFTKRTGLTIKVKAVGDAGTALSAAILTEGKPEGDVFFGVDNTLLSRASGSRAFVKYRPAGASRVPPDLQLDATGKFTAVDDGPVCINADRKWFTSHQIPIPTSLSVLTEPEYKNLLVVENPAASSTGMAFLVATHATFGDATDDFWRKLKANGVVVADSWDDAWNSRYTTNGGNRPLVVSYASSPPAEIIDSDGKLTRPRSAVMTSSCFQQIEFVAQLAGAPHATAAHQLIDEMLSPEWQQGLPLSNYVYPAITNTPLPEIFSEWTVPIPNPLSMTPADIDQHRTAWIDSWRQIME
jgi:thiamine transport system substrate-binding protein